MTRVSSLVFLALAAGLVAASCASRPESPTLEPGPWRGVLSSPGGELPFLMEIAPGEGNPGEFALIVANGEERIPLAGRLEGRKVSIPFPHYDAEITATLDEDARILSGLWSKALRTGGRSTLPFEAEHGPARRFEPRSDASEGGAEAFAGRWRVLFEDADTPAVGVFEAREDGRVGGTILTATGDYRFLEGRADGRELRLSTFDGAHAFLFSARLMDDGSLAGDFWSRDVYHVSWTALRDDEASLPDGFSMTAWDDAVGLEDLRFRTLEGDEVSLADPAFAGRARIIEVFGSWCPNCNDSIQAMVDLHRRYRDQGLSIVGLAFEYSESHEDNARQVQRFVERYDVEFPVLVAGKVDRDRSHEMLPLLERIKAYPTTIFIDAEGHVRAVHTGFAGPATGPVHDELLSEFERLVQELLSASPPSN